MVNKGNMSPTAAEEELKGTVAADKNEILFSRFGINYNNEPEMFRKGSVVFREYALVNPSRQQDVKADGDLEGGKSISSNERDGFGERAHEAVSKTQAEKMKKLRRRAKVVVRHVDIIKDEFWVQRPWLWTGKPGELVDGNQDPSV